MDRDNRGRFVKGHKIIPIWCHRPEIYKKISETLKKNPTRYWLGKKFSEEYKRKLSLAKKGKPIKHWIGRKLSKAHKDKLRVAKLGKYRGEKASNWRGGISREQHSGYDYDQYTIKVFRRDNYICRRCKKVGGILNAHHIKNYSEYPNLRHLPINGITLCQDCHKLFHSIYGYKNNTLKQSLSFIGEDYKIVKLSVGRRWNDKDLEAYSLEFKSRLRRSNS